MRTILLSVVGVLLAAGLASAGDSDVTASDLQIMEMPGSQNFAKYSLKVTAQNNGGPGYISIFAIAKNNAGFELKKSLFSANMAAGESKNITTTATIERALANTITSWEIEKTSKIDK